MKKRPTKSGFFGGMNIFNVFVSKTTDDIIPPQFMIENQSRKPNYDDLEEEEEKEEEMERESTTKKKELTPEKQKPEFKINDDENSPNQSKDSSEETTPEKEEKHRSVISTAVSTPERKLRSPKSPSQEKDEDEDHEESAIKEKHLSKPLSRQKFNHLLFLGFPPPQDAELLFLHAQIRPELESENAESKKHWDNFFATSCKQLSKLEKLRSSEKLRKLIRHHPIPGVYRPQIWKYICGAQQKITSNKGYYQKILQVHKSTKGIAEQQIDLDLTRTFPDHIYFKNGPKSQGYGEMKRILTAFSWRNPLIAYCQSLNYIVGFLLLHFCEEDAFWMLVTILEDILPLNYYTPDLKGLRVDGKVLDYLLAERLPKIHAHFQAIKVDTVSFVSSWFLRIFVDVFPVETTLRTWDLFFHEGSKILFRAAMGFLKLNEAKILQMEHAGELLHFLNQNTKKLFDHNALIKQCFSFTFLQLKREHIEKLRLKFEVIIDKETEEMDIRRKQMKKKLDEMKRKTAPASPAPGPSNRSRSLLTPSTPSDKITNNDDNLNPTTEEPKKVAPPEPNKPAPSPRGSHPDEQQPLETEEQHENGGDDDDDDEGIVSSDTINPESETSEIYHNLSTKEPELPKIKPLSEKRKQEQENGNQNPVSPLDVQRKKKLPSPKDQPQLLSPENSDVSPNVSGSGSGSTPSGFVHVGFPSQHEHELGHFESEEQKAFTVLEDIPISEMLDSMQADDDEDEPLTDSEDEHSAKGNSQQ